MSRLPLGWAVATLGDIGEWSSGGTPSRARSEYYDGDIPWVKTGDLEDSILLDAPEKITQAGLSNSSAKLFPPGTLLVAMYGATIGKTALLGVQAATNQACAAFLPSGHSKDLIPFLWKFTLAKKSKFIAAGQGGAQPNISQTVIKQFPINIPPLAEQQRIVVKLDALNTKSVRARTELARIETLVSRYKQAVLSKVFGEDLSGRWPKMQIGQTASNIFDGPFGSNLKSADYTVEGPRVIRLENIGARAFIEEKRTHVSDEKFSSLARHQIQADDLLFSSFVSEEVRACLFPKDVSFKAINKADCFCIRFDKSKIYPQFALLQLTTDHTYRHFVQQVHGATRPRINLSQLKSHLIFIPSLAEQQRILSRVESAFAKIDRLAAEAKRALELVGKLDEAILAKAFRGELVPQDESDEPASVLLDRICAEREAAPKLRRRRKGAV